MSRASPLPSIYALCDPDSGMVRYVGKADDPAKRLKTHVRESRRRNCPVQCWLRGLIRAGKMPELVVIRTGCVDWKAEERALIAAGRKAGYPMLNLADGGDQPYCPSRTLAENASRLNAGRHRGYWAMMRAAGAIVRRWSDIPERAERVAGVRIAMDKLRAMSPERKEAAGNRWLQLRGEQGNG